MLLEFGLNALRYVAIELCLSTVEHPRRAHEIKFSYWINIVF